MLRFPRIVLLLISICACPFAFAQKGLVRDTLKNGNVEEGIVKRGKRVGEWKMYSKTGILLSKTNYSGGKKNGTYTEYGQDGRVRVQGSYSSNNKDGKWSYFYGSGDTLRTETYRDSLLHGYYAVYDARNGSPPTEQGIYVNGVKDGRWTKVYSAGPGIVARDTMYFALGKETGTWVTYHNTVLVAETHYVKGMKEGAATTWYDNGTLKSSGSFYFGNKHGVHREYSPSGKLIRKTEYRHSFVQGNDSTWDANTGKLIMLVEHPTREDTRTTVWTEQGVLVSKHFIGAYNYPDSIHFYYSDGKIKERLIYYHPGHQAPYRDPVPPMKSGAFIKLTYYQNGALCSKETYLNEFHDGPITYYDSLGHVETQGQYDRGQISGEWIWKNPSGVIIRRMDFVNSAAEGKYISYYADGKMRVSAKCKGGFTTDSVRAWNEKGVEAVPGTALYDTIVRRNFREELLVELADPKNKPVIGVERQDGGTRQRPQADEQKPDPYAKDSTVYSFAETMPAYPGGEDSLQSYFKRNKVYPSAERSQGKEGTVYVNFIVEKDGSVSNVRIVKAVAGAPGFSEEAIRLVSNMPEWTPGTMRGWPVRVQITIPVKFVLNQ